MRRGGLLHRRLRLLCGNGSLRLRWRGSRGFRFRPWQRRCFVGLQRRRRCLGWLWILFRRSPVSRRFCRDRSFRLRFLRRWRIICRHDCRSLPFSRFRPFLGRLTLSRKLCRDRSFRRWFLRRRSIFRRRCCRRRRLGSVGLRRPYKGCHRITRRNRFAPGHSDRQWDAGPGRNTRRCNQGRLLGGQGHCRLGRSCGCPFRISVGQGNLACLCQRNRKRAGANGNCRKQSYRRTGPGFEHD